MKMETMLQTQQKTMTEVVVKSETQKKMTRKEVMEYNKKLLQIPEIRDWIGEYSLNKQETGTTSFRRLSLFCREMNLDPMEFAEIALKDKTQAAKLMKRYRDKMVKVDKETGKNNRSTYIDTMMKGLRSWLNQFGIENLPTIKSPVEEESSVEEQIPNAEEMAEIFRKCDLRTGAIISLQAKAGLRWISICKKDASDGLTLGDLPDHEISNGKVTFTQYPPMIKVRKTLNLKAKAYNAFITTAGAQWLLAYFNERLRNGEQLTSESPVISPDKKWNYNRGKNKGKKFLGRNRLTRIVKKSIEGVITNRPYDFRSYFSTCLHRAQRKKKMDKDVRIYLEGRSGKTQGRYNLDRKTLSEEDTNDIRESFRDSESFLDQEINLKDFFASKQMQELNKNIRALPPEHRAQVQEFVRMLAGGKTSAGNGSYQPKKQNEPSMKEKENTSEHYPMEKSSSKNGILTPIRRTGPKGFEPST